MQFTEFIISYDDIRSSIFHILPKHALALCSITCKKLYQYKVNDIDMGDLYTYGVEEHSVSILELAREYGYIVNQNAIESMIQYGYIDMLDWTYKNFNDSSKSTKRIFEWSAKCGYFAAKYAQIPILEWFKTHEISISAFINNGAVLSNNIDVLNWVSKNTEKKFNCNNCKYADIQLQTAQWLYDFYGLYFTNNFIQFLITNNKIEIVAWLGVERIAGHIDSCYGSVTIEMFQLLHSFGYPIMIKDIKHYISNIDSEKINNEIKLLNWIYENGPTWGKSICIAAVQSRSLDIVKYVHNRTPLNLWNNHDLCYHAINSVNILKWLRNELEGDPSGFICPWNQDITLELAENEDFNTFKWVVEQGCPWDIAECLMNGINNIRFLDYIGNFTINKLERERFSLNLPEIEKEMSEIWNEDLFNSFKETSCIEVAKWILDHFNLYEKYHPDPTKPIFDHTTYQIAFNNTDYKMIDLLQENGYRMGLIGYYHLTKCSNVETIKYVFEKYVEHDYSLLVEQAGLVKLDLKELLYKEFNDRELSNNIDESEEDDKKEISWLEIINSCLKSKCIFLIKWLIDHSCPLEVLAILWAKQAKQNQKVTKILMEYGCSKELLINAHFANNGYYYTLKLFPENQNTIHIHPEIIKYMSLMFP